ncbi:unnamed protein product, partial [Brenthis ino]
MHDFFAVVFGQVVSMYGADLDCPGNNWELALICSCALERSSPALDLSPVAPDKSQPPLKTVKGIDNTNG